MDNLTKEQEAEMLTKQEIEKMLDECPSPNICNKIQNFSEKKWCIDYVYKQMTDFSMTMNEAMGQLDSFLNEIKEH